MHTFFVSEPVGDEKNLLETSLSLFPLEDMEELTGRIAFFRERMLKRNYGLPLSVLFQGRIPVKAMEAENGSLMR